MTDYIAPTREYPYVVRVDVWRFGATEPTNTQYIPCTNRNRAATLVATMGDLISPLAYTAAYVARYKPLSRQYANERYAGSKRSEYAFLAWFESQILPTGARARAPRLSVHTSTSKTR